MLITKKRILFAKTVYEILFQSDNEIALFKRDLSFYDKEFRLPVYLPSLSDSLNNVCHEDGKTYLTMNDTDLQSLLPILFLCFLHMPHFLNGEHQEIFINGVHINSISSSKNY